MPDQDGGIRSLSFLKRIKEKFFMDYNVKPMIHRFRQNNMNIVMDVNSGIVHVVDDVTYKVLEYYN